MLTKALACAAVLLVLSANAGVVAYAADPVICGNDLSWDGQKCQLIASSPGRGVTQGSGDAATSISRTSEPRTCSVNGAPIPCHDADLGWWMASRNCYVRPAAQQPVATDPIWEGRVDWALYECSAPRSLGGAVQYVFLGPRGLVGVDPRVLAQTAIASMNLTPISIGIVPEDVPGSVGLVGMPVWLWADEPDQQSWGPITRSASAGAVTVTATAQVQKMRWQMGDGGVVVCTGPGTVYEDRFGKTESPTCGYTYRKQGTYTVRAESQWSVIWSGMGQSGTIPITLTQATTITVGELQVLTIG